MLSRNIQFYYLIIALVLVTSANFSSFLFGTNAFKLVDDIFVFIIGIVLILLGQQKNRARYFGKNAFFLFLISYLVSTLMGLYYGYYQGIEPVIVQLRNLLLPFFAFQVAAQVSTQTSLRISKFLVIFTAFICLPAIFEVAIQQNFWNAENAWGFQRLIFRPQSIIGHPTDFGYFVVIGYIFLLSLSQSGARIGLSKSATLTLLFLFAGTVLGTLAKGPIIILILSSGIVMAFFRKKALRFSTLFAFMLVPFALFYQTIFIRFGRISEILSSWGEYDYNEFSRQNSAFQTLPVVSDHLFFGVGPGLFGNWVATSFDSKVHARYGVDTFGTSSLDVFALSLAAEHGLFGIAALLAIVYTIGKRSKLNVGIALKSNNRFGVGVAVAGFALTVSIFISAFTSMIPMTLMHMWVYWLIMGLSAAQWRQMRVRHT